MAISDFYQGTTKKFSVTITYNGTKPDITNDTIRFILKQNKGDDIVNALINVNADVVSYGTQGKALFNLSPTDTNINPGKYYYLIDWSLASGEYYVLEMGVVEVKMVV